MAGQEQAWKLPARSLAFTVCQVPVGYTQGPAARLLVEYRDGTRKVVDGDLLDEDERAELDGALKALRDAIAAQDGKKIHHRTDGLDRATQPLAERRMDRAVQQAMKGRAVAEIEDTVKDRPEHPHLAASYAADEASDKET